jgi:predicted Zn-dependent protease with MMP-like domain
MSAESEVFDDSYEKTYQRLRLGLQSGDLPVDTLENELEALCAYEGLDWTGRGELKQAEISGAITAYQAALHRWKSGAGL